MSTRPYPVLNDTFPPPDLSNSESVNNSNPHIIHNAFTPSTFVVNKPRQNIFGTNEYTSVPPPANVSYRFSGLSRSNPSQMSISTPPPANFSVPVNNFYPSQPAKLSVQQNYNMRPVFNHFQSNCGFTTNNDQPKDISYLSRNVGYTNEGYASNACHIQANDITRSFYPSTQNTLPENPNINNIASPPELINNPVTFPGNSVCAQSVTSTFLSSGNIFSPQMQNCGTFSAPPPIINRDSSYVSFPNILQDTLCKKEMTLQTFLKNFSNSKEQKGSQITVPEYRSVLKAAFSLMKLLSESKSKLSNLVAADEGEWKWELQRVLNLKKQLSELCSLLSAPVHLNTVTKKLKLIKRKRELKKKTKLNKLSEKIKQEQIRKDRHREIDKYLDDIKEKNSKLKWEAEMKKEADYILAEVRRKIHEAKRTIEKIKLFEKLRHARQATAVQKGLRVLPEHDEKFEHKMSLLKETMQSQLSDYEAEERALRVMLETEQEGQLEEETQWRVKKARTLQQLKKKHIIEALFGNQEDPAPSDPLFLFHSFHTSADGSIENLVQIRHHWDVHLSEEGEAVPQPWVVPVAPSSPSWEQCFTSSVVLKS